MLMDTFHGKWFDVACQTIVVDIKGHQHVQQQVEEPIQVTMEVSIQEATQDFLAEEAPKEAQGEEKDGESWGYKRCKRLKLHVPF